MEQIRAAAGDDIEGMTPTVVVPGVLNFKLGQDWITRPVTIIGIDSRTQGSVSDFCKYLQHPSNRASMDFALKDGGYDTLDHQAGADAIDRPALREAGWPHRRRMAEYQAFERRHERLKSEKVSEAEDARPAYHNPFAAVKATQPPEEIFDPAKEQHPGIVLGIALASFRDKQGKDQFLLVPGDDVKLTFPKAGTPPTGVSQNLTVVDFYESKMSEYDSSFVFVPIHEMQRWRGMIDPNTDIGRANSIQIKLKPGSDLNKARDAIAAAFPEELYHVQTWRDKQSAVLSAVQLETAILNVLLFLIIAVAGFGILAIFFMIVVEKTRDVGILKALGASRGGIMGIFLAYGLSLGLVGSGVGLILGLLFVRYINEIADILGKLMGHEVFDPSVYSFFKIPTIVEPLTIAWIVFGALAIAVAAAVFPARRAAALHPVEALRYE
jgi:lipoprotein-releasing system permease protein